MERQTMNTLQARNNHRGCYFFLMVAIIYKLRDNVKKMFKYASHSREYIETDAYFILKGNYLSAIDNYLSVTEKWVFQHHSEIIENYERAIPTSSSAIMKLMDYYELDEQFDIFKTINYCNEILSRNEHPYYMIRINIMLGDLIHSAKTSTCYYTIEVDKDDCITSYSIPCKTYKYRRNGRGAGRVDTPKPQIKTRMEYYITAIEICMTNNIKITSQDTIRVLDYLIEKKINIIEYCCYGLRSGHTKYLENLSEYYRLKYDYIMFYIFALLCAKHEIENGLDSLIHIYTYSTYMYNTRYDYIMENAKNVTKTYLNNSILGEFSEYHDYILEHFSILSDPNIKNDRRLSIIFLQIVKFAGQIKDDRLSYYIGNMYAENKIKLFQQY